MCEQLRMLARLRACVRTCAWVLARLHLCVACAYVSARTYASVRGSGYVCKCVRACARICMRAYASACVHTCLHACVYAHASACALTQVGAQVFTHVCYLRVREYTCVSAHA